MYNDDGPTATPGTGEFMDSDVAQTPEPYRPVENGSAVPDAALQWRALPERVKRVWLINEAIQCAFFLAGCAVMMVAALVNNWWFFLRIAIGLIAVYAVLSLAFQPIQTRYAYAFNRFRIGERDMSIRKGWLFRSSTTIPFNRVQHVDTKQNPVLRHFGLTKVVVHTAVGEHEIDALDNAKAEHVVRLITERVDAAKEDL